MKHGSLFSGIGGIDLGFEMAGIETTWTCEIDDWCNELLQKRFPNATHYRDVQKIGKDNLEPVDIISGGFPCQDISTAGKGAGLDGKRSGLWFEMWRIICELRPRWVFIENVANLANKGGERVLHDLAEAGYDAEWQVISARDVGGRHLRKRLWIIAYRKEISDTLCRELEGHNRNIKRKNRNTTRRRDNSKSVVQRRDIEPFNTQTTSKRGTTKDIERQDNRDGKFRIKTFEILKNEPELDRVAYGLSQKVDRYNDRVKGLGNAVVPQIPYQLGKRIKELNNLLGE
jgi:DNA (cytosine-5)-methyltransferase 1